VALILRFARAQRGPDGHGCSTWPNPHVLFIARDNRGRVRHACDVTDELRIVGDGFGPEARARVAAATRLGTLEDLLRFGFAQRPAWELVDVIVQDEFTHDVIVRGPAPAFLVFDTT
jgi:hypothetical protein